MGVVAFIVDENESDMTPAEIRFMLLVHVAFSQLSEINNITGRARCAEAYFFCVWTTLCKSTVPSQCCVLAQRHNSKTRSVGVKMSLDTDQFRH